MHYYWGPRAIIGGRTPGPMPMDYMPDPVLNFALCQLRVSRSKNKGQRWTVKDKAFSLSLCQSSPKTYRLLQKVFKLPFRRTLCRSTQKIRIYTGFRYHIPQALEWKVLSMSNECKLCMIARDRNIDQGISYLQCWKGWSGGPWRLWQSRQDQVHRQPCHCSSFQGSYNQVVGYFLSSGQWVMTHSVVTRPNHASRISHRELLEKFYDNLWWYSLKPQFL